MIQLVPIIQIRAYEQILKSIYFDSFPADERRDWNELLQLTHQSHFNLYSINNNDKPVGLITIWEWPELLFIEHFAIDKTSQGKGIGSEVLYQLMQKASFKIILETEEPNTEYAKRRISFYTRLGFHLSPEEYYQPAYSKDKGAVKMLLMSYPDKISHIEFLAIRTKLYMEVYNRNIKGFS